MKATLKVLDRIALQTAMNRLTHVGYAKFVTARDVRKKVVLTQEELNEIEAHDTPDGNMQWNSSKDKGKEFDFTERETNLISEVLSNLDKTGQLEWGYIPIYEMFVVKDNTEKQ